MRVVPVIDLMNGQVVRGFAGRRSEYRPVQSSIADDALPATVARAFVEGFGFDTAYVADLDAILHGRPDFESYRSIAEAGLQLWLDAGLANSAQTADTILKLYHVGLAPRLVIGLESLESEAALAEIQSAAPEPLIFSLDLMDGRPSTRICAWKELSPLGIAQAVHAMGIGDLIVLDLADVGTNGGTRTLELCRQIRQAEAFDRIIAGGGVRGVADLQALASAGCNAALVASALHDGRLTRDDIEHLDQRRR